MFVTMPQFEVPAMTASAGRGQKHLRAVTALFPVEPWYMFVFEAPVLDARVYQTVLVAWEESLLEIIDQVPAKDRRSVYRLRLDAAGNVAFRIVEVLWAPTEEEAAQGVGAVLGLEGESDLLDPSLRPVAKTLSRRLVFQKPREGNSPT